LDVLYVCTWPQFLSPNIVLTYNEAAHSMEAINEIINKVIKTQSTTYR